MGKRIDEGCSLGEILSEAISHNAEKKMVLRALRENSYHVEEACFEFFKIAEALNVLGMTKVGGDIFEHARQLLTSKNVLDKAFGEFLRKTK
jgi:hypothetical protein